MHKYEMMIMDFMKTVAKQSVEVDKLLLKPAAKDVEHYIKKMMEEDPNRPFKLRLSSIAKPLCQQQMQKANAEHVEDDWNFPLRMMYGGIIEGLTVSILRHAGIKVDEEQTHVKLTVGTTGLNGQPLVVEVPGTLDLVLEGHVWDVKSASPYAFKEKFASYQSLKASDDFGYIGQLYGYSEARKLPPGGWIVVDKSSGVVKVIPVPDDYRADMAESLQTIENNVKVLTSDSEFKRCFSDVDEKFNKRFTGSKVLESPCTFCKYKYSCWPGLQFLPVPNSKAYEKPHKYYTKVGHEETNVHSLPQSEGPETTKASRGETLGDILNAL